MKAKQKNLLCSLIGSAVLLSTAPLAFAAEGSAKDTAFNLDEYVVTANRMPVKKSEVAANVTVITQEEIEKSGAANIYEILNKSNVDLQKTASSTVPALNGDDRVLVLVDGRRMNWDSLVVSGNKRAGANLDLFPIKNIERIEIVRGPASSLYGSDAAGGIINIITRKEKTAGTSLSSEFGSWGLRHYTLSTEGKENAFSYRITAEKKKQNSYNFKNAATGKNETLADTQVDQEYLTMNLANELNTDSSLSLDFEHGTDKSGFGGTNTYLYPGGHRKIVDNNVALTYHWGQDKGADNFLRVYRNASNQQYFNSLDTDYKLYATGLNWQQNWQLNKSYTLTGGADWREENLDDHASINQGYTTKALFIENRWQLANKWSVTAGTRYDDHSMAGSNYTSRVTLNKELHTDTNVYASWGQYVKNPSLQDLFSNTQWWSGNPDLKPEEGSTVTLGINTKLRDGSKLQASLYSSRLKNAFEWENGYFSGADYIPGYYYNVGREKRQGLDLTINRELSQQWTLGVGYTYSKIEVQNTATGNYMSYTNNSQPNAYRLNIQYAQDKWDAGLTLRSATGRSLEQFTSSSYVTLDLVANYKLNSATRIFFKGYNLTNRAYELTPAGNYGAPGAYPMPGRSFSLGVEYRM